jgi:hypothetical protein
MIESLGIAAFRQEMESRRGLATRFLKVFVCILVCASFLAVNSQRAGSSTERVNLFPKLRAGQTIYYRIHLRSDKSIATQSRVVMPLSPTPLQMDILASLRMEILGVQSSGNRALIHARTLFEASHPGEDGEGSGKPTELENSPPDESRKKIIEFTVLSDGQLADVKGQDALLPEEHQVWAEWISLFAMAAVFPGKAVKRGEKWESEETVKEAVPIAGLSWLRRSTYVQNEPCESERTNDSGAGLKARQDPETCAVIVTSATLRQKSSKKDATPEDFKRHDLQTMGTARGKNQVIAYISLKTGLLMRATEEANQSMDVILAKADGSNRVHYKLDAKSSSEALLVADKTGSQP